jgi:HlyD family secretion protein
LLLRVNIPKMLVEPPSPERRVESTGAGTLLSYLFRFSESRVLLFSFVLLGLVLGWLLTGVLRAPVTRVAANSPDDRSVRSGGGGVGCLGRIEPQDGVLQLSAAYFEGRPQRVRELDVKQGDHVRAGQLLAVLDGEDQLQTAVRLANARVDLARTRLAQVKTGAKASDIAAQKAQVDELRATLENARAEYHRYEVLHENTDVSSADLDAKRLAVQTTERKLEQAEERLNSLSEIRPTDVDVAESELRVAIAEADRARAQLKLARVYSPFAGRVLKIRAYPGEEIGPQGLLELGKTDSMYVEAEVDETDIRRVHVGQHAVITSDLFPGSLSGTVQIVDATITKGDVLPLDPVSFADARVFKVRIRLDDGKDVTGYINGKVNVVIQP